MTRRMARFAEKGWVFIARGKGDEQYVDDCETAGIMVRVEAHGGGWVVKDAALYTERVQD